MSRITLDQANKLNEGGGKYFKLSPDESKQVRFLLDKWDDIHNWVFGVHALQNVTPDGTRHYSIVDCPKASDENAICKYCAGEVKNSNGSKNVRVGRVVIPLFNIDEGTVQYWTRSADYVTKTLKPVLDELSNLPSIANQTFKIKRTGTGLDTVYTPIAVMNASDTRTKADFGELEDPYELGIIKKYGEENQQGQQGGQQAAQGQPVQPSAAYQPRRTTEVF